ncbi:MAG: DUF3373 family protein [Arcobacteraceae bacterium]|jgi:hypothetical protein|nr:DUF3373 family protein [Arcobacteraceae bacterium]
MKKLSLVVAGLLIGNMTLSANSDLEAKVALLEKQLAELKSELKSFKNDTTDILDNVETAVLTDKVKMGFTFRTRFDSVETKNSATATNNETDRLYTTKLNLNLKSDVSDTLKFTGRLTAYKNWGNNYPNMYGSYDSKQGRIANDSGLFMERAYIDWTAYNGTVPVILTVGRQPSSDGPSWQFAENSVRKGTYDALIFDGAADGIVATMPLAKATGLENSAFRLAYGKGVENESYENATGLNNTLKDNSVYGVFAESSIPGLNDSLVQLSYATAKDVIADSNATNGQSQNVGDLSWYGILLEASNIKNTGLDLFAHYAHSKGKANGKTVGIDMTGDGTADYNMGLIDGSGSAYWLGARYDVGFGKIGLEYNHGSKNWFSMTTGSLDPLNKLATRGNVTDIYFIKNIDKNAHVKVGYMDIDYKYSGSGMHIGTPMTDTTDRKNGYLEFVVNF